jgi:hypothetical protein
VPDRKSVTYPYITYQAAVGSFEALIPITASIWDKSYSWERVDALSDSIETYIKQMRGPKINGGRYRVYVDDTDFSQHMGDPDDDSIRRAVLNVIFEFMV